MMDIGHKKKLRRGKETLPDHILYDEILTKLPAKSLLRFKSVSRKWCSTIRDQRFIRLHHEWARTRPDGGGCLAISMSVPKGTSLENNVFTAGYRGGPASHLLSSCNYIPSKSTHGLILLSFKSIYKVVRPVFIYNPTTRELASLPPISKYINDPCDCIHAKYYLGYDPLTEQYKVLAMCTLVDDDKKERYYLFIFILSTESRTWRKLDIAFPVQRPSRIVSSSACCVNGAIHWLVHLSDPESDTSDSDSDITNGYEFILTFDVGNEMFRELPLPGRRPTFMGMLLEVGGQLALSIRELGQNGVLELEVLVMESYDKGEWKKLKVETPLQWNQENRRLCEVRAINCGEKLSVTPRRGKMNEPLRVHCYDKSGKKWSIFEVTFELTGLPVDIDFLDRVVAMEVSNNVETLFSPKAGLESNNVSGFHSHSPAMCGLYQH